MKDTKSFSLLENVRRMLAKRGDPEGDESGFTLIELMVVLLIMAILLAIAIPTFLGVKGGAQDRAAQSNLTNAIIDAKSYYVNNSNFGTTASLVTALEAAEPELSFVGSETASSYPNTLSVDVSSSGNEAVLAMLSQNGSGGNSNCFFAEDNESSGVDAITSAPQGITYNVVTDAGASACDAAAAPTSGWSTSYPTGGPS
jgi:type IV pilus assembly protein PilA